MKLFKKFSSCFVNIKDSDSELKNTLNKVSISSGLEAIWSPYFIVVGSSECWTSDLRWIDALENWQNFFESEFIRSTFSMNLILLS